RVRGVGGVGFLTGISAIAAGDTFTLALTNTGTVYAWGYNGNGELGDGTTTASLTPVQVRGIGGAGFLTGVVSIAANTTFAVARLSNGAVVTWGYNGYGQLGDGTTGSRP